MGDQLVITPGSSEEFIALSESGTRKRFKKHILSTGPLNYNTVAGGTLYIDDEYMDKIVENFKSGVCPIVQVPIVDDSNKHSEDPTRNIGRVVDLSYDGGKLYAIFDAEKHAEDIGKTLIGASAMISTDYLDTRNKSRVGPTLLHMAITNRPHIVDLGEFEEIIAASGDSTDEAVMLTATDKENDMDLQELITKLETEHGVNVTELQERAGQADASAQAAKDAEDAFVSLSNSVSGLLEIEPVLELSNSSSAEEKIIGAITEITTKNLELSGKLDELEKASAREKAEHRVDSLVTEGKITPAARDAQVELLLSSPEIFEAILPTESIINLSGEPVGTDPVDTDPEKDVQAEIDRLSALNI